MDELGVKTKGRFEYRTSSMMVFTETWLHQDISNSMVEIKGMSLV